MLNRQNTDSNFEDRLVLLTDAQPNSGRTDAKSLLGMVSEAASRNSFTTFVGVGLDFNADLISHITKVRGANYFCVRSSVEFLRVLDDEFDYFVQRENQKRMYRQCLDQFSTSSQYNDFLASKLGAKYHLVQYDQRYKHETLQILTYQFSSMGGTNHAKILQLSVADGYRALSHELDHLHKTGLGLLLLDEHRRVCLIHYCWDHCDMPPSFDIRNDKYRRKYEICCAALHADPLYQKHIARKEGVIKYGEIQYDDMAAVRPDLHIGLCIADAPGDDTRV